MRPADQMLIAITSPATDIPFGLGSPVEPRYGPGSLEGSL
jgi:hypothetical protein